MVIVIDVRTCGDRTIGSAHAVELEAASITPIRGDVFEAKVGEGTTRLLLTTAADALPDDELAIEVCGILDCSSPSVALSLRTCGASCGLD
jgi:hypothetical protein